MKIIDNQIFFNFDLKIHNYCIDKFLCCFCDLYDKLYKRIFIKKYSLSGYFKRPSSLTHPEFFTCFLFRRFSACMQGLNLWNLKLHLKPINYAYFYKFKK